MGFCLTIGYVGYKIVLLFWTINLYIKANVVFELIDVIRIFCTVQTRKFVRFELNYD